MNPRITLVRGRPRRARRESGAALLVAVMMLALMGLIGFASLDTVMRDRQVAGNMSRSQAALYAADAGVAEGIEVLRSEILPDAVHAGDCLSNTIPNTTLPNGSSFGPDAADPQICMIAKGGQCEGLDASLDLGFQTTIWNVQTQGQAPGGSTTRVQATVVRCHAFGS